MKAKKGGGNLCTGTFPSHKCCLMAHPPKESHLESALHGPPITTLPTTKKTDLKTLDSFFHEDTKTIFKTGIQGPDQNHDLPDAQDRNYSIQLQK